jgi:DNA-binding GntR family transcriptional regulator
MEVHRPPTLVETVVETLRGEILKGNLLPGSPLQEVDLSKSLNVSRGTVRAALRQLNQEGIVEVTPYHSAFVATLSAQRVKEIYTLRSLLEPYAVRLSMENGAFEGKYLEEMRQLIVRMGELEQAGDYEQTILADIHFHNVSSANCGHELLLETLHNLQSRTLMFILTTKLYRSDMISDEVSHQAIFDGIAAGDPAVAEEIVRRHINDAGSSLVRRMEELAVPGAKDAG